MADGDLLARYRELLDQAEWKRYLGIGADAVRHEYLVARALVRTTLSCYVGVAPERLRFVTNRYGRPRLKEPGGGGLCFNLSHTTGLVVLAVARGRALGVDAENIARRIEPRALARSLFAPGETAALEALDTADAGPAFLNLWTLKEAYIKAVGKGFAVPLDSFTFACRQGALRLCRADGRHVDRRWQCGLWDVTGTHRLAVAIRTAPDEVVTIRFRYHLPLGVPGTDEIRSRVRLSPLPDCFSPSA